ncbi:hypothetical protein RhiirA5_421202 [Rhizophagus irregularis]|uniref:Uncharacterized protein n=1 Tax=Rhizophagus irregularis TaxID=588596 RepID=A0A2N0PEE0_9GLOM|nr:hypothetical protein RhiirA5_421202 [Rhizophagus irregularis]
MEIFSLALLTVSNVIKKILINKMNNTESNNRLHRGKRFLGNALVTALQVTINRGETGLFKKACGMVTYEIDGKYKGKLPLLLIVGWKISIIGKNQWFVFIGYKDFPDESSINEYFKENGNTGTNTLDFKKHSISITGSISDG